MFSSWNRRPCAPTCQRDEEFPSGVFPAILTWNQPYRFEKVNRSSLELVSDNQLVLKRLTYGFKQKKKSSHISFLRVLWKMVDLMRANMQRFMANLFLFIPCLCFSMEEAIVWFFERGCYMYVCRCEKLPLFIEYPLK